MACMINGPQFTDHDTCVSTTTITCFILNANTQQTHLEYLEAKHKVSVYITSLAHILTLAPEAANIMMIPQAP